MTEEGKIEKVDEGFLLTLPYKSSLEGKPGIEVFEGPDDKVCRKLFTRKKIYLPGEEAKAVQDILAGPDVVVLGMNGYSALSAERCQAWGIKPGAYEAACQKLLHNVVRKLQAQYAGVNVRIVHGASNMGVDEAVMSTCRKLNLINLGHNCPRWMIYVQDDDEPVYVAQNQSEYSRSFVRSLDILIAANGAQQSFSHDIAAAFEFQKHVIPINLIGSISTTGGPAAISPKGLIEDAVAAFNRLIHQINVQTNRAEYDAYADLCGKVESTVINIARPMLSPARAYQV